MFAYHLAAWASLAVMIAGKINDNRLAFVLAAVAFLVAIIAGWLAGGPNISGGTPASRPKADS